MFQELKLSLRRLRRNARASVITIGGLALGITAYILILEYVSFEKSVNSFHKNLPQIYRLINESPDGNTWSQTEPGWAKRAKDNFSEIKEYCRYEEGVSHGLVRVMDQQSTPFREENMGYADGNFFSFFSFPIVLGNADALKQSNTVFLSKEMTKKYFGTTEPIGKTLTLYNQFGQANYTVSGVFEIPANSDIRYGMVFSLETLSNPANLNGNGWAATDNISSQYITTCFLLQPNADPKKLEAKLTEYRTKTKPDKDGVSFRLQSFASIHLGTSINDKYPTNGNLRYVYILSLIAILILAIAWFNYINMSTANAIRRAGEVGVRKVIGASRTKLVAQFLVESLVVYVLSFSIAVLLAAMIQPFFNELVQRELSLSSVLYSNSWLLGFSLMIGGSLLAAIYTAYSLTRFNPIETLKGKLVKSNKGIFLRKALVVMQFFISISLILATVLIYNQLRYMQSRDLGLNPSQVIVIRGPEIGRDSTYIGRNKAFLNEVGAQSFVKDYTQSGSIPGNYYNFTTSGFTQPGSKKGDEFNSYSFAIIDHRYLKAYGIALKAGRSFTAQETEVSWNQNDKVLINEKALALLGFKSAEEALSTRIQWDERSLQVVGVVKDYHHTGLQREIDPMIFYPQDEGAYTSLRVDTRNVKQALAQLETIYKNYFPANPFEHFFEDENFNKQYLAEQQYGLIFSTASVWAILIACLGLFGLTTYTIEAKTKEIGIRKVLGASVSSMVRLLSVDFLKLIFIACILAAPVAWWAMDEWLKNFAYRIKMEWWIFVAVGLFAGLVALLTIGIQTIKAALVNPVKSLRND